MKDEKMERNQGDEYWNFKSVLVRVYTCAANFSLKK